MTFFFIVLSKGEYIYDIKHICLFYRCDVELHTKSKLQKIVQILQSSDISVNSKS